MNCNVGSKEANEKEGEVLAIDRTCSTSEIERTRIDLLREMLASARSPNDPSNGIYPQDYPFAKLGIQRLRATRSHDNAAGGYLARLDVLRQKHETEPRTGIVNDFHAVMSVGFDYAVLLIDEWLSMRLECVPEIEPKHEGPSDGTCTS